MPRAEQNQPRKPESLMPTHQKQKQSVRPKFMSQFIILILPNILCMRVKNHIRHNNTTSRGN